MSSECIYLWNLSLNMDLNNFSRMPFFSLFNFISISQSLEIASLNSDSKYILLNQIFYRKFSAQ